MLHSRFTCSDFTLEIPGYYRVVTDRQRRPVSSVVHLYSIEACRHGSGASASEPLNGFNGDELSSFGLLRPDNREVDLSIKGDVEIVREDVDGDMRDDFADLRLRKPGLFHPIQIRITDVSAFIQ